MSSVKTKTISSPMIPSARFSLAIFVFFGCVVQYTQRINLPIGIVCMINKTYINTELESIPYVNHFDSQVIHIPSKNTVLLFQEKRFPWTEFQQQMVLGAYWIGYLLTLIPGNENNQKNKLIFYVAFALYHRWLVIDYCRNKANIYLLFIVKFYCNVGTIDNLFS